MAALAPSSVSTPTPFKMIIGRHRHRHCLFSSSSLTAPLLSPNSGRRNLSHQKCLLLSSNKPCKAFCSQVKLEENLDDETCELVSGADLVLGDDTDAFRAYLLTAVKNNNSTGVLILSDIYGFESSSTRDFAYRVACNGYNVLVPDLFRGNPWTSDQTSSEFDNWVAKQPAERVAKDVKVSAQWMVDELLAAGISDKLGIIGFSFGGGKLIETLARDQGAYFSTAVCFYGTHMNLDLAADVKVPVLFISGDSDPHCGIETLEKFEKGIGRGSRVVVFEGEGHGFVHKPETPEADKNAEEAFLILRNWFHEGLVAKKN